MKAKAENYMKEALKLARSNIGNSNGGPFGAVIVKDGKIIAKGANEVTSTNDPTAHAEIVAIRKACKILGTFQLDGCEIYTSCEPCPMCMGAIYWARPKKVFFAGNRKDAEEAGFDDSHIYSELSLPLDSRKIPTEQIMAEEAQEIFEEWLNDEKKVKY